MKSNKRSFASMARTLNERYKNRTNDKMLEAEYHNEMQKLVQQQEAARAQMGLTNDNGQDRMMPQQFGDGSYIPLGQSRQQEIPSWNLPQRGLNYLGEKVGGLYDEYAPDVLKEGVDWYDKNLGEERLGYPINTGIAPMPGRGFKGGIPTNINFAKNNAMYNIAKNTEREIGSLGKTAKPIINPINEIGSPIRSGTYTTSGTYPIVETPAVLTESRGALPSAFTGDGLRNEMGQLDRAFGLNKTPLQKVSAGMRQKGTAYPSEKTLTESAAKESRLGQAKKSLDELAYEDAIENANANKTFGIGSAGIGNTSWNKIGYGALGAGVLGGSGYGLSQIDSGGNPIPQSQNIQTPITQKIAAPVNTSRQNKFNRYSTQDNPILYDEKESSIVNPITTPKIPATRADSVSSKKDAISKTKVGAENIPSQMEINEYIKNAVKQLKPEVPNAQMNIPLQEASGSSMKEPLLNQKMQLADATKSALETPYNPKGDKSDLTNSYISAGATALNNILQGVLTKKPKSIAAPSYTPKELDLSDRALEAKRQAELSSNISRNQARNLGLNAGATIANQAGAQSGIDRNLAGVLTDINLAEQQYNVGEQNKAGMFNAEAKYKNDLINQQLKDQYDQKMLDSLSGTIGTIPELITDINKIKAQNKAFKNMTESEKAKFKLYEQLFPRYKGTGFDNSGNVGGLIFNKE